MSGMKLFVAVVLAAFLALTGVAVAVHGYVGFFEIAVSSWATRLMLVDLVIALSLVLVWMWSDARERGIAFVPYAVVTALLGSAGPLLYLLRRKNTG